MLAFPFSNHRGDRDLARALMYEHGLDVSWADWCNPEVVEVLAGTGQLTEAALFDADREWRNGMMDAINADPSLAGNDHG